MRASFLLLPLLWHTFLAHAATPCYSPDEALTHANKDICIFAHVYDVVEMADGTRFLDVCKPDLPDDLCRFTIVTRNADRKSVGSLASYRDKDITIRGTVHVSDMQGVLLLNDARQFHGGKEKFEPNPALLRGFSAEDGRTAFNDPSLKGGGRHRSIFKSAH
jgi:hypothetical protein